MDHVKLPIVVRKATAGDVASMQAVDVVARQRFRDIDDARIARAADDQPYWAEGLTRAATERLGVNGREGTEMSWCGVRVSNGCSAFIYGEDSAGRGYAMNPELVGGWRVCFEGNSKTYSRRVEARSDS